VGEFSRYSCVQSYLEFRGVLYMYMDKKSSKRKCEKGSNLEAKRRKRKDKGRI
jgi:hypothetical protein